jgi:hypothetical protein
MMTPFWLFLVSSCAVAVTTGFANSSHEGRMAQVVQGLQSIPSLAAIVAAFASTVGKPGY